MICVCVRVMCVYFFFFFLCVKIMPKDTTIGETSTQIMRLKELIDCLTFSMEELCALTDFILFLKYNIFSPFLLAIWLVYLFIFCSLFVNCLKLFVFKSISLDHILFAMRKLTSFFLQLFICLFVFQTKHMLLYLVLLG